MEGKRGFGVSEYIEREALLQEDFTHTFVDHYDVAIFEYIIERAPAADVVEVRHGWWAKKNVGFLKTMFCCSICGGWEHGYAYEHSGMNYCPACGARMDGKGEGE
jgi:rubrerythrin